MRFCSVETSLFPTHFQTFDISWEVIIIAAGSNTSECWDIFSCMSQLISCLSIHSKYKLPCGLMCFLLNFTVSTNKTKTVCQGNTSGIIEQNYFFLVFYELNVSLCGCRAAWIQKWALSHIECTPSHTVSVIIPNREWTLSHRECITVPNLECTLSHTVSVIILNRECTLSRRECITVPHYHTWSSHCHTQ